jgi:hypothetical protein
VCYKVTPLRLSGAPREHADEDGVSFDPAGVKGADVVAPVPYADADGLTHAPLPLLSGYRSLCHFRTLRGGGRVAEPIFPPFPQPFKRSGVSRLLAVNVWPGRPPALLRLEMEESVSAVEVAPRTLPSGAVAGT